MSIVGIDLGTTNSLISVFKDGNVVQIPNSFGEYLTPSVVSFDEKGNIYVGKIAKERKITNPDTTVSSFKKFMGTDKKYKILGKEYTPEDLSAMVLRQLIEDAKKYLNEEIEEAIISVPAYFNNKQRNATKRAGSLAGIKVERIINEPSAAASYYYVKTSEKQTFLVFDFGGGTLDISIVDAFENIIEVVAIVGDNHLGGDDFDLAIAKDISKQNGFEWQNLSAQNKQKILKIAESCKFLLNTEKEVMVKTVVDGKEIEGRMSRKHLIEISSEIFYKIKNLLSKILRDAEILADDIDNVLLVGGSSNMVVVQDYIKYITNKKLLYNFKPDMLVGLGVGMVAGIKERNEDLTDIVMTDVCPFSMGINTINRANEKEAIFAPIIQRNTTLPVSRAMEFSTAYDNQREIVIKISQGENYYCSDNLEIGKLKVTVPKGPEGKEKITVRFTYDINGILEVEVKVLSTGEIKKLYIQSDETNYSEEEMKKMMENLKALKQDYREKEEIVYVMELGKRLYEESMGELRNAIGNMINRLEYAISAGDDFKIRKTYEKCISFFETIDSNSNRDVFDDYILEDFMKEEDGEDGDEDDLEDFTSGYTDD